MFSVHVFKTVFVQVDGLGKHTMDSLKKLAPEGNPHLPLDGVGFVAATKYLPDRSILKFQHFLFTKDDLLNVQCRHAPESEPTVIRILKHSAESTIDSSILPRVLPPAGLSPQHLQYL